MVGYTDGEGIYHRQYVDFYTGPDSEVHPIRDSTGYDPRVSAAGRAKKKQGAAAGVQASAPASHSTFGPDRVRVGDQVHDAAGLQSGGRLVGVLFDKGLVEVSDGGKRAIPVERLRAGALARTANPAVRRVGGAEQSWGPDHVNVGDHVRVSAQARQPVQPFAAPEKVNSVRGQLLGVDNGNARVRLADGTVVAAKPDDLQLVARGTQPEGAAGSKATGLQPQFPGLARVRKVVQVGGPLPGAVGTPHSFGSPSTPVTAVRHLGGGINATYTGELNGAKVVFKPQAEAHNGRVHANIPGGADAEREHAARLIANELGVEVPMTEIREVPGYGKAIVQQFVSASTPGVRGATMQEMALLDSVIGNEDRHSGNFLTLGHDRYEPIDHGLAFPEEWGHNHWGNFAAIEKRDGMPLTKPQTDALTRLKAKKPAVDRMLTDLGLAKAAPPMWRRVDALLKAGEIVPARELGLE